MEGVQNHKAVLHVKNYFSISNRGIAVCIAMYIDLL